jgi:hypothetical protein
MFDLLKRRDRQPVRRNVQPITFSSTSVDPCERPKIAYDPNWFHRFT